MNNLKLTAKISDKTVSISKINGYKVVDQKNVTGGFRRCLITLYKDGSGIVVGNDGKKYVVILQEIKEEETLSDKK